MSTRLVLVASVALSLASGQAFAESEGNGEPFSFKASPQVASGQAFVSDTGTAAFPNLTGVTVRPSSLAGLEPAAGSEASVQTASSLPRGFSAGSVASVQARNVDRHLAGPAPQPRLQTAGVRQPRN